jgi:GT2 family glycosyltransferase
MGVRLSVVIVSYNTEALLRDCLASISRQKGVDLEVIVVDNASTDGTRAMVSAEFPAVKTIFNDRNARWAGGNNQGAAIASGEILLFLNSDTVVCEGALARFITFFDAHPDAAIAGCRLLNVDGSLQRSCRGFPTVLNMFSEASFLYLAFPRSDLFGAYYVTNFGYDAVRQVDMVAGAAFAVRSNVFREVGPFDEDFHFYSEETDYCYRAQSRGRLTFYFPDAAIVHHGGGSPQPRQAYYENLYAGLRRYLLKHHRGVPLATMIALQWIGTALRVPVYFLKGLMVPDRGLLRKSVYYLKLLF